MENTGAIFVYAPRYVNMMAAQLTKEGLQGNYVGDQFTMTNPKITKLLILDLYGHYYPRTVRLWLVLGDFVKTSLVLVSNEYSSFDKKISPQNIYNKNPYHPLFYSISL